MSPVPSNVTAGQPASERHRSLALIDTPIAVLTGTVQKQAIGQIDDRIGSLR